MSSSDDLISVNYGPTNDVYDSLMQADSQIAEVIDRLDGAINQLLPTWSGNSADVWQAIQKGWNAQIQTIDRKSVV